MTALLVLLALSLVSASIITAIYYYDKWKYGECVELPDGGIVYSKSINKGVLTRFTLQSFAPEKVTKGFPLQSLTQGK